MGHETCSFRVDQALFDGTGEHSSAATLTSQSFIICCRIKSEDTKLESVLSSLTAMATTSVAIQLGQQRNDIYFEIHGGIIGVPLNTYRNQLNEFVDSNL